MISDLPCVKILERRNVLQAIKTGGGTGLGMRLNVIYFIAARMRVKEEFRKNQSVTDQNQILQVR